MINFMLSSFRYSDVQQAKILQKIKTLAGKLLLVPCVRSVLGVIPALLFFLQFKRLQGKRNRGREEINFVDIKGDDQLSGAQQWLTKSLTEEKTMKSFSKVGWRVRALVGASAQCPSHSWSCAGQSQGGEQGAGK